MIGDDLPGFQAAKPAPDPLLSRWQGAHSAAQANQPDPYQLDPGPIGGFIASSWSSIPEMFGQNPTDAAEKFRTEHPIAGVVSELLPTIIPYAGVYKLSELPAMATKLEGIMARTGLNALDNPVAYGAVKEMVRYAPFELGRLGIGLATAPTENYGNLLADVGLSTVLAGGFGGIGGFFKAGGKLLPQEGRVVGADMALKPTFELRMAQSPTAEMSGDVSLEDAKQLLTQRVLTETPADNVPNGVKALYVQGLEHGDPDSDRLVNSLFRPTAGPADGVSQGLERRLLTEGPEANRRTLDEGEQQHILGALGLDNMEQLASTLVYPRDVRINSQRAAGTLAKALDSSPALQYVAPGVLIGREGESGLWVVAKRWKAGGQAEVAEGAAIPKTYGAAQVAEGDRWILAKTDKPQLFAGDVHKLAEMNVAKWAEYREAFQPSKSADVFNTSMDTVLQMLSPQDYRDLRTLTKAGWTSKLAGKISKTVGEETGLAGSKTLHDTVDFLYNALQPTMFKEARNPVFGRLFGLLNTSIKVADEFTHKIIRGKADFGNGAPIRSVMGATKYVSGFEGHTPIGELWGQLWEHNREDFHKIVEARNTRTPAEDLAKLTETNAISHTSTEIYKKLQAIDTDIWNKVLLPTFKGTDMEGQFSLLEGYIGPRVFKGDHFIQVVDDAGKPQWLASGKTGGAAQGEALAVIAEAKNRGHNWKVGDEYLAGAKHAVQYGKDAMSAVHEMVANSLGKSKETQDIVQRALRQLESARAGSNSRLPKPGIPGQLKNARTGMRGSPDLGGYNLNDVVKQSEAHYGRLLRFAGHYAWRDRWAQEAVNLSKSDPTLYKDLMNKANQFMGIEGQITQTLNKTLEPLLGSLLGGKAATRIAQASNALVYNWNLAIANPVFALVNALQPLQTVLPAIAYLGHAPAAEIAAHYHVMPKFGPDGKAVGIMSAMSPMKVLGAAIGDLRNASPELRGMLERATTDGTLQHSQVEEWVGAHSSSGTTIREAFQHQGAWAGITRIATWGAQKSEGFSRMVSATAMYRVGKFHFGLEGDQLYKFMQRGVHVTNYGYSVVDRSNLFTGPVGSMFGMFKNWQLNYIGQMMQYAGLAAKDPLSLKAWSPLLWQAGSAVALGGLGATPLLAVADGLAKWNSDSPSSFAWMQKNWPDAADELYYGLPAFLGVSLQASASVPGTDVKNEISSLMSFVFIERAKAAGKALGDAYQLGTDTNTNALRDPNVRDELFSAFLPRAMFKAISAVEGDYVRSMSTGYPTVRGLSPATQMMAALGFNPIDVARHQTAAKELYADQTASRNAVQSLGENYAQAMSANDSGEMQRVIDRAVMLRLPLSSVMHSANTRLKRESQDDSMSHFDRMKVAQYVDALGSR
jgi:hypothetical protein